MLSIDGLRHAVLAVCAAKDTELMFYGAVIALVAGLIGVSIGLVVRRKQ